MFFYKIIILVLINILFSNSIVFSENLKPFKEEILFGLSKNQLKNDTRSISSKKALSIYSGNDGKALKITLDPKLKGHKDDWGSS